MYLKWPIPERSSSTIFSNDKQCRRNRRYRTRGQNNNTLWFEFRKRVITASKCHDILTKMTMVLKGGGGGGGGGGASICTPSIKNIPALKYGKDMEDEAVNDFFSAMKLKHKTPKMIQCGLFSEKVSPVNWCKVQTVYFIVTVASPACVEIMCPFSINYILPHWIVVFRCLM